MKSVRDFARNDKSLYNWLRGQVGRPWNKVYSEISQIADPRSRDGQYVRKRLGWYVEQDVLMVDKTPHNPRRYGNLYHSEIDGLWVNPKTGILCYNERKRYYRNNKSDDTITYDDGSYCKLEENGCWLYYWTEIVHDAMLWSKKIATDENGEPLINETNDDFVYERTFKPYDRTLYHKRQLSSKEVKQLRLNELLAEQVAA